VNDGTRRWRRIPPRAPLALRVGRKAVEKGSSRCRFQRTVRLMVSFFAPKGGVPFAGEYSGELGANPLLFPYPPGTLFGSHESAGI